MTVIESLKQKRNFFSLNGATDMEIEHAQKMLNLVFADDYIDYLRAFGLASFEGHELTGICAFTRLNVVDVTKRERDKMPSIAPDWYVIEETNMDDVVIWQDSVGGIYRTVANTSTIKLCDSLIDYVNR